MEKINIAELLRDCPQGMELDCTMYQDVYFDYVDELNIIHCYIQHETHKVPIVFNQHGTYNSDIKSKCVIFPKGKTTWEGFVPLVNGDVIYTDGLVAILFNITESGTLWYYCYYSISEDRCKIKTDYGIGNVNDNELRLATEEEKQKLFDAIEANGYKWNDETKTLVKLIEPKFKVGDKIRHKESGNILKVDEIDMSNSVYCCGLDYIWVVNQDDYELVPNKFDITNLKPFDKVLTRVTTGDVWGMDFFGYYKDGLFHCNGHTAFRYCIPFKNNEHLLSTTGDCDDFYKTWEK